MVVLDTSALLYWTFAPDELSARASQAIGEASQVIVSSISIWEIGVKVKRGKLEIPLPVDAFVAKLQETDRARIEPVTEATWLKNLELVWNHKDPADRTIVATASLLSCPLVTSDQEMRKSYSKAVW
jgi:PIN domain nuclease of toxin-antitoxin system